MTKYCTNCGKKLNEGETCECINNTKENSKEISDVLQQGVNIATSFINKPIDTAKKYLNGENFTLSIIFVAISSILASIFMLLSVKEVYSLFFNSFAFGYDFLASEIPYFRVFMTTFVFTLGFYFLETLVLWLFIDKLTNKRIDYKKTFNIIGLLSIYNSIVILISILGIYVSIYIVLLLFIAALILNLTSLTLILKEFIKIDVNKLPYIVLGNKIVTVILGYIIITLI